MKGQRVPIPKEMVHPSRNGRPEPQWNRVVLAGDSWSNMTEQWLRQWMDPWRATVDMRLADQSAGLEDWIARASEIDAVLDEDEDSTIIFTCVGGSDVLRGNFASIPAWLDQYIALFRNVPMYHITYQTWTGNPTFTQQLEDHLYTPARARVNPGAYELMEVWQYTDEWECVIVDGLHANPECYEKRTRHAWYEELRRRITGRQ